MTSQAAKAHPPAAPAKARRPPRMCASGGTPRTDPPASMAWPMAWTSRLAGATSACSRAGCSGARRHARRCKRTPIGRRSSPPRRGHAVRRQPVRRPHSPRSRRPWWRPCCRARPASRRRGAAAISPSTCCRPSGPLSRQLATESWRSSRTSSASRSSRGYTTTPSCTLVSSSPHPAAPSRAPEGDLTLPHPTPSVGLARSAFARRRGTWSTCCARARIPTRVPAPRRTGRRPTPSSRRTFAHGCPRAGTRAHGKCPRRRTCSHPPLRHVRGTIRTPSMWAAPSPSPRSATLGYLNCSAMQPALQPRGGPTAACPTSWSRRAGGGS